MRSATALSLLLGTVPVVRGREGLGSLRRDRSARLLEGGPPPAEVARKFATIENDWQSQVSLSTRCADESVQGAVKAKCDNLPILFDQACSAIAKSFVNANRNEKHNFEGFMDTVCGDTTVKEAAWRQETCQAFKRTVAAELPVRQEDQYHAACQGIWAHMSEQEQSKTSQVEQAKEAPAEQAKESDDADADSSPAAKAASAGGADEDASPDESSADQAADDDDTTNDKPVEGAESKASTGSSRTSAAMITKRTRVAKMAAIDTDREDDDDDDKHDKEDDDDSD